MCGFETSVFINKIHHQKVDKNLNKKIVDNFNEIGRNLNVRKQKGTLMFEIKWLGSPDKEKEHNIFNPFSVLIQASKGIMNFIPVPFPR